MKKLCQKCSKKFTTNKICYECNSQTSQLKSYKSPFKEMGLDSREILGTKHDKTKIGYIPQVVFNSKGKTNIFDDSQTEG